MRLSVWQLNSQTNIDAWEEEDNLSHERNRNERRQRDWEKSVKKNRRVCYHNPMFSDKVLPIANKAVTNTDAGRGECDVENFDMIVQDLNTIAEYFTPKIQSNKGTT
jgi:hypothetical protein